jgi:hypothetical protein
MLAHQSIMYGTENLVHQFYIAVIERIGRHYFPLTDLLQVVREKNTTASHAVYTKLHSVTDFFHI